MYERGIGPQEEKNNIIGSKFSFKFSFGELSLNFGNKVDANKVAVGE